MTAGIHVKFSAATWGTPPDVGGTVAEERAAREPGLIRMSHAPDPDSDTNIHHGLHREQSDRANRIASSQEQLLHAQLQQLGLESGDASLEPTPDTLLAPPEERPWSAHPWGSSDLTGTSPWGPPPLHPMPYHRRGASDIGGFRFPSSQPSYQREPVRSGSPPFPSAPSAMEQQRQAIQQQIEQLQLQQQHLMRQQQLMQAPLPSVHEERRSPMHRRIQSQSATSSLPLESNRWPSSRAPLGDPTGMRSNPNFSFPPRRATSEAHTATSPEMHARRPVGHTRHASYQLASELSPEYLMAAGGMLSASSLALGNGHLGDLADGFADSSGVRRPAHARSTSMSSAPVGGGDIMANLAQAQSQLAALHRSRQQAGPGAHARSASYSGHRSSSHGGGGGGGNVPRKALFGSYLPQSSLAPLLLTGKLVVGILRVNKRNRSDAWVTTEVLDSDIFISGSKDRNRALEGDLVAVELLDPQEVWQTKRDKVDKKKRKEESAQGGARSAQPNGRRTDKARDDTEVEGAQLKLVEDEEESENAPPALAGHVVAIVERVAGQLFPGTLGLLRPSSAATKEKQQVERSARDQEDAEERDQAAPRPKIVWFRPSDKRVPLIAIPADQAPADFWDDAKQDSYAHCLFVACIKRWPITSLHPFGTLVDQLGPIGDLHAEAEALLRSQCNVLVSDFGEACLKALPPPSWTVPLSEYPGRRTFGATVHEGQPAAPHATVLGVPGTNEVALSVEELGDRLALGVHIADASYFVRAGSALDREAKKRVESVSLVSGTYNMLPPALAEHAAGLVVGHDRLAMSVVLIVGPQNDVQDLWLGKSVVHVAHAPSYDELQHELEAPYTLPAVVQRAASFAASLRQRRAHDGAVALAEPTLHFSLNHEGYPEGAEAVAPKEDAAHTLVHELILRANTAAAHTIAAAQPESALLVRADQPSEKALQVLRTQLAPLQVSSEQVTAARLPQLLGGLTPEARPVVEALVSKALPPSRFYSTGMVDISKFAHYQLPAPIYTACAAPLSQYAQLCVQRQLVSALTHAPSEQDAEAVAKIAQQANVRHKAVRLAQEQSAHLFLCQHLHRTGPQHQMALVMIVGESSVDLLVPALAIEKRVHLDQLAADLNRPAPATLSLTWHDSSAVQVLQPLASVPVEVQADTEKSPPVLTVALRAPRA